MSILKKLFGNEEKETKENEAVASEKKEEAKAPAAAEEKAEEKKGVDPKDRKPFVFLIDSVRKSGDNEFEVKGNVHGQVLVGEDIFILNPGVVGKAEVKFLETMGGISCHKLEDQGGTITITVTKEFEEMVRVMAGLSNIPPTFQPDVNQPLENPYLKALIIESPRHGQDPNFANLLIFMVCHSFYLVPFTIQGKEPVPDENGQVTFDKDSQIQFHWLTSNNPDDENPAFALFTDYREVERSVKEGQERPKVTFMTFVEAVEMNKQIDKPAGIVINPFTPQNLNMTPENIANIVATPGYQQEFVKKEAPQAPQAPQGTSPEMAN